MKRHMRKRVAAASLVLALATGSALPVYADGIPDAASAAGAVEIGSSSIGSVFITGKSYIEVKQAAMIEGDNGKTLAFTMTLHNEDDRELQFIDYWVRLTNKAGTTFSVDLMPQDKDKNRVPAHSSVDLNMVAKVSQATEFSDLIFRIVKWDFYLPNYERTLGTLKVPDGYEMAAPPGSARIVNTPGAAVKMHVASSSIGKNSSYYLPKLKLTMENVGMRSAELPAYQYAIRTSEGLLYPLEAKGLDDSNRTLHPRFTRDVQLSGTLPVSVGADGWELVITNQIDSGNGKLTLPVAMFVIPEPTDAPDDTGAVPAGQSASIELGDQSLDGRVTRVVRSRNDAYNQAAITFALKNEGKTSVKLPEYRFAVRTADGLTYPAKVDGLRDASIDPLVSKNIQLTASVPTSVSAQDWKLIVLPPVDGSQPNRTSEEPLAVYVLTDTKQEQGSIGTTYEFAVGSGYYGATLDGIQRLPWEDDDILSASLTLEGKSASSQPIPALTGYFLLDGAVRIPAAAVVKDNAVSTRKGTAVELLLYGKLPYTTKYASVKLVLQEAQGDSTQDLLEFRTDSATMGLPLIAVTANHKINNIGRKSQLSIRSVRTYSGGYNSELFSAQLNVKNLEKRQTAVANLVAYFQDEDEAMYPAEISKISKKVAPGGTATLLVSANIPGSVNRDKLTLIVGTGVKDGKPAEGVEPDGYIDAVSFSLPKENTEPKKDMLDLDFFPYTISLSRFHAQPTSLVVDGGGIVSFGFDYSLSKNAYADTNIGDHRLILEFKDLAGSFTVSRSFELDKPDSDSTFAQGKKRKVINFNDDVLFHKLPYLSQYKVEIYDEYNGHKRLLASKQFEWNIMSDSE